jgi:hypothetical protein
MAATETAARRLVGVAILVAILCLLAGGPVFGAETKPLLADNPEWCRAGFRCITIRDYAAMTLIKIDLETEVSVLKAKRKRALGIHATCGLGVAVVATEDWNAKAAPAGYCGIGYGF